MRINSLYMLGKPLIDRFSTSSKEIFKNSKYRDVIIRLDSKELEAKITLNPPKVQPLLGRVIIPILELRNKELEGIADLAIPASGVLDLKLATSLHHSSFLAYLSC